MHVDPYALILRSAEAAITAAPTLLLGFVAAGVLRAMVGPAAILRLFGTGHWSGPLRAWGLGTLLPVCSLGALPILRELRRAGVPRATLLTFALAAPVLNPFSLLYGSTLLQPWVLAVFVLGSMVVAVGAGLMAVSYRAGAESSGDPDPEPMRRTGFGRLARAGMTAAREVTGPAALDVLVGLLGVGLLGASLPHGTLMYSMVYQNARAPLTMAAVAPLVYISPERAMMLVGEMYEHSSSPGAAFVLLVLGTGINLGTLAWAARALGSRTLARWSLGVLGLTLVLGYEINATCYLPGSEEGHTHIFDNFSRPSGPVDMARLAVLLTEAARPASLISLGVLAGLIVIGAILRVRNPSPVLPDQAGTFEAATPETSVGVWNRPLPATWGLWMAILGLLGLSVAGAYIYYPSPNEMFEDIRIVRVDAYSAVQSGTREAALGHVIQWERMIDRLPIGELIRRGFLDARMRETTREMRDRLELLRNALKLGRLEEARTLMRESQEAHDRCRLSYLGNERHFGP